MRAGGLRRVRRICCRCGGPDGFVLFGLASSRASPLPHWFYVGYKIYTRRRSNVGAGLLANAI